MNMYYVYSPMYRITTIKYKYYITIGPWSWCDPTRVIFSLLLIVDVPDILSVPFRVTRPGRRLATKTTTTATSQNKSVKVPYRQRTKKVIRRLSTRSYREYSSARSSSLSLSLSPVIASYCGAWLIVNAERLHSQMIFYRFECWPVYQLSHKKERKEIKESRGNVWQASSKDCDRSSTLCVVLSFFFLF
jgi:hypothetical protein